MENFNENSVENNGTENDENADPRPLPNANGLEPAPAIGAINVNPELENAPRRIARMVRDRQEIAENGISFIRLPTRNVSIQSINVYNNNTSKCIAKIVRFKRSNLNCGGTDYPNPNPAPAARSATNTNGGTCNSVTCNTTPGIPTICTRNTGNRNAGIRNTGTGNINTATPNAAPCDSNNTTEAEIAAGIERADSLRDYYMNYMTHPNHNAAEMPMGPQGNGAENKDEEEAGGEGVDLSFVPEFREFKRDDEDDGQAPVA